VVHGEPDRNTQVVPIPGVQEWRIEPGKVNFFLSTSKISGTFTRLITPVKAGGAPGDTGGACLIYQYDKAKVTCKNDDECNSAVATTKSGTTLTLTQGHGYCDKEDSTIVAVSRASLGTCWYKPLPDDSSCMKSPTLPLIENIEYQTPLVDTKGRAGISWRVITRQNLAPLGSSDPADTTRNVIRFGEPWPPRH
jgi:hypothetical protein